VAGEKTGNLAIVPDSLCLARQVRLFRKEQECNHARRNVVKNLDFLLQRRVPVGTPMRVRIRVHAEMPCVVVGNGRLGVEKRRAVQDNASVRADPASVVLLLDATGHDICGRTANMHHTARGASHALTRDRVPYVGVSAVHRRKHKGEMPVHPPVVNLAPCVGVHRSQLFCCRDAKHRLTAMCCDALFFF